MQQVRITLEQLEVLVMLCPVISSSFLCANNTWYRFEKCADHATLDIVDPNDKYGQILYNSLPRFTYSEVFELLTALRNKPSTPINHLIDNKITQHKNFINLIKQIKEQCNVKDDTSV